MAVSKMLEEKLKSVKKTLATAEKYEHAANVLMQIRLNGAPNYKFV